VSGLGLPNAQSDLATYRKLVEEVRPTDAGARGFSWALSDSSLATAIAILKEHTEATAATPSPVAAESIIASARDADWEAHYAHTLMRCRTMSDKALRTRVKVIARAKGQHCLTKLEVFSEVLGALGKLDIKEEATEALALCRSQLE
jgi:hypothetical protein